MRALLGMGALAAFLVLPAAAAAPSGRIVFFRDVGEQAELFSVGSDAPVSSGSRASPRTTTRRRGRRTAG